MQNRRSKDQAGFSMVELILAMTITLTVMGLASSILAGAFKIRSREDRKSDGVADVQRACDFYTTHLGFELEHRHLPEFATVALGPLMIHLSGPGASGSRALPGGERQSPGGSSRVVLRVTDLPAVIYALRSAGATFRNDMETGPAGRQVQVLDPDGNPIELFEPAHQG